MPALRFIPVTPLTEGGSLVETVLTVKSSVEVTLKVAPPAVMLTLFAVALFNGKRADPDVRTGPLILPGPPRYPR